ncbi:sialin-like [Armigeres subalbatus]|uniref:sialin-like n=1 Tax=Armigeres subalbatus TaxID=124917 RepID=UPI002ED2128B
MYTKLKTCCQAVCCITQQHLTAILAFFSIVNQYTMRVSLNLAITEMTTTSTEPTSNGSTTNDTIEGMLRTPCGLFKMERQLSRSTDEEVFDWDEHTQGIILSAFFWGYVLSHFGSAFIADKYTKTLLGMSVLVTAILTLLTPLAIDIGGAPALIAARAIEGFGEGATFPVLSAIIAHWIPPQQRGMLGSFIFSGGQIGSLFGGIGTGYIIAELHSWRLVFYVWGGFAVVWYVIWEIFGFDSPETHPFITDREKQLLMEKFSNARKRTDMGPIPWKRILTSLPFWALVAGQVGHDWGFYLIATDLPKYMKSILGLSVKDNGLISFFPFLSMWVFSVLTGWICDVQIRKKCISPTTARKFWTTIGSLPPAVLLLGASYAGCNKIIVIVYFALSVTLMGGFYPGIKVNVNDLSPNYAGFLMAIVNGIGAITGIIVPYTVGLMTPNQTLDEWRFVFWIAFWVLNVTNVIFIVFGSGKIQPWNDPSSESANE